MPKNLTKTPHGTQARIRLHGVQYSRHFPTGTSAYVMERWLLTTRLAHGQAAPTPSGLFRDDARVYLAAVAAMPSIATRTKHIEEWVEKFGQRRRDSVTAVEIAGVLNGWRTTPRTSPHGRYATRTLILSATAVNHRRTALMHLWTVMDGKGAPNPVRSVPKFREPQTQPRALPYPVIRTILAAMGPTKSHARLLVMAHTGLPQAQLTALTPADVDLCARTVIVPGRRKGGGTRASVRPLTRKGAAAFRLFARRQAWGHFSNGGLRRAFHDACDAAGVPRVTPYVLRHSFGTALLTLTGDLHATQQLMGHATPQQTQRYAMGASDARLKAAVAAMNGAKV